MVSIFLKVQSHKLLANTLSVAIAVMAFRLQPCGRDVRISYFTFRHGLALVSERQAVETWCATMNLLWTVRLIFFGGYNSGQTTSLIWRQPLYLSCSLSLSFACRPTLHPSLLRGTSGSAFYHDNRQRFKLGIKTEHKGETDKYAREKTKPRWEIERDRDGRYEVRRVDIRTDTVQQMGSYEDIWRIHEAVMNLFGFFYRSARVSLMDKVGAGKHISVMARHCRKNKLNSLLTFHTLSTPFSLSPSITHFLPLWFSIFVSLFSQSFFVWPSLSLFQPILLSCLHLCVTFSSSIPRHSSLSSAFHCVHPK